MEPKKLGVELRKWRETKNLGPIKVACRLFGVSHATLGAYEQGNGLPDVDFLAKFADVTGADFNELLRLRLASGKTEEARVLAGRYMEVTENKAKYEIALDQLAEDDAIRGRFLGDAQAARRSDERLNAAGAKLRETRQVLQAIEADLGYTPPEYLHQVVLTLMFNYSVPGEWIAVLLDAISRLQDGQSEQ